MKVKVARTAGFCWGVQRAMDAVLESSARWGGRMPIQTMGPLIHNPQALDLLARRGVCMRANPAAVQDGAVVIRAHGIPLQDYRLLQERRRGGRLKVTNATCPEVGRVQALIKKFSAHGYFTVILGDRRHPEVVAHQSYAAAGCAVVADLAEAARLSDEQLGKALVVAQTTFTEDSFRRIVDHLRSRNPQCLVRDTICRDTGARQQEARILAQSVDAVVVVGGRQSNNTRHLAEVVRQAGRPVQSLETAAELDLQALPLRGSVAVLAGASTPNWIVDEVVNRLQRADRKCDWGGRLAQWSERVELPGAVGVALMSLGVQRWMGLPDRGPHLFLPFILLLAWLALQTAGWGRARPSLARIQARVQRALPGIQDLFQTGMLCLLAAGLPLVLAHGRLDLRTGSGLLLVSALAFTRSVTGHLEGLANDRILGRETLAKALGRTWCLGLVATALGLSLAIGFWVLARSPFRHPSWAGLALLAATLQPPVRLAWRRLRRRHGFRSGHRGLDSSLYLAALLNFV